MRTFWGPGPGPWRVGSRPEGAFRLLYEAVCSTDEPLPSLSSVAHYLLMQRARDLGVKVLLCGQGGDELLCGYLKYWGFYLQSLMRSGHWGTGLHVLSQLAARGTALPQIRLSEAKRYLPPWLVPKQIDIRGPRLRGDDCRVDISLGAGGVVDRQLR